MAPLMSHQPLVALHRMLPHEVDHPRVLVEDGGVQLQPVVAHRVAYDGRGQQLLDRVEGVELDLP